MLWIRLGLPTASSLFSSRTNLEWVLVEGTHEVPSHGWGAGTRRRRRPAKDRRGAADADLHVACGKQQQPSATCLSRRYLSGCGSMRLALPYSRVAAFAEHWWQPVSQLPHLESAPGLRTCRWRAIGGAKRAAAQPCRSQGSKLHRAAGLDCTTATACDAPI